MLENGSHFVLSEDFFDLRQNGLQTELDLHKIHCAKYILVEIWSIEALF
jgi:hypothetical protein